MLCIYNSAEIKKIYTIALQAVMEIKKVGSRYPISAFNCCPSGAMITFWHLDLILVGVNTTSPTCKKNKLVCPPHDFHLNPFQINSLTVFQS